MQRKMWLSWGRDTVSHTRADSTTSSWAHFRVGMKLKWLLCSVKKGYWSFSLTVWNHQIDHRAQVDFHCCDLLWNTNYTLKFSTCWRDHLLFRIKNIPCFIYLLPQEGGAGWSSGWWWQQTHRVFLVCAGMTDLHFTAAVGNLWEKRALKQQLISHLQHLDNAASSWQWSIPPQLQKFGDSSMIQNPQLLVALYTA